MFVLSPGAQQRVQIELPTAPTTAQTRAAEVLVDYLGRTLSESPVIGDVDDADLRIVIGSDQAADGVAVDAGSLGPDGFHLSVKGSRAVIIGGHDKGAIYGAYELMEELGFRLCDSPVSPCTDRHDKGPLW